MTGKALLWAPPEQRPVSDHGENLRIACRQRILRTVFLVTRALFSFHARLDRKSFEQTIAGTGLCQAENILKIEILWPLQSTTLMDLNSDISKTRQWKYSRKLFAHALDGHLKVFTKNLNKQLFGKTCKFELYLGCMALHVLQRVQIALGGDWRVGDFLPVEKTSLVHIVQSYMLKSYSDNVKHPSGYNLRVMGGDIKYLCKQFFRSIGKNSSRRLNANLIDCNWVPDSFLSSWFALTNNLVQSCKLESCSPTVELYQIH